MFKINYENFGGSSQQERRRRASKKRRQKKKELKQKLTGQDSKNVVSSDTTQQVQIQQELTAPDSENVVSEDTTQQVQTQQELTAPDPENVVSEDTKQVQTQQELTALDPENVVSEDTTQVQTQQELTDPVSENVVSEDTTQPIIGPQKKPTYADVLGRNIPEKKKLDTTENKVPISTDLQIEEYEFKLPGIHIEFNKNFTDHKIKFVGSDKLVFHYITNTDHIGVINIEKNFLGVSLSEQETFNIPDLPIIYQKTEYFKIDEPGKGLPDSLPRDSKFIGIPAYVTYKMSENEYILFYPSFESNENLDDFFIYIPNTKVLIKNEKNKSIVNNGNAYYPVRIKPEINNYIITIKTDNNIETEISLENKKELVNFVENNF